MNRIEQIELYDGYILKARIAYPDKTRIEKLVIYINGSGANTYENKRSWIDGTTFKYHDFFANEFLKRNIAYCSYNTRGVDLGENEPCFAKINEVEYKKHLPSNSIRDIESIIIHLQNIPELQNSKVFLLGWSEGTIIAPLVALNGKVRIDGLLLAGYCNENLRDTLTWQLSGNAEYLLWKRVFDYDNKGYITKEDFETDKYNMRNALFGNQSFEDIDKNDDGKIDVRDAAEKSLPYLKNMLNAIELNDDEWLKNNHGVRLTSAWFREHFKLKATKDVLPLLNLPIFIFQGEADNMCPAFYAEEIKLKFDKIGKTNLNVRIFKQHDHDLNYTLFLLKKEISQGISCIFETVEQL